MSTPTPAAAAHPDHGAATPDAARVGAAQEGRPGPTQRRAFAPTRLRVTTSRGRSPWIPVRPVDTASSGELRLPADPGRAGWWRGGALAGEAFGSVVLAGHIDSRSYGLGAFARLLDATRGDLLVVSGGALQQRYRVRSSRTVAKPLLTATDAFSAAGPARLVLITCTGHFNPATRHYDSNLVVTATPVGLASPLSRASS